MGIAETPGDGDLAVMKGTNDQPLRGVFPVVPTPFLESGELDLEGQGRVLDCMLDQGVDGLCILANFSEQFSLSDPERDLLVDVCLEHVEGRLPVIVACSHFSTRIAAERARRAAQAGASLIMLMPPYHGATLRAHEQGIVEHLARVADAARLPIMLQDAPLSGVQLSPELLARIASEVPAVSYFKIEVPQAAAKLRRLMELAGDSIQGPFDGEESVTLMPDLDAGATGTMCSALAPDLIRAVVEEYRSGRRTQAAAAYARILPLINFENRQCGLRAAKTVMMAGGVIRSDVTRHPMEPLPPPTRAGLLELVRDLEPLALRWGH
jgi:2-keto-3-deoxy-L-arabinonate dehydratase